MTDINEYTKDIGVAVDDLSIFPEKYNRTSAIHHPHRRELENLHKLFPLVVRFPRLFTLVPKLIRLHFLRNIYLAIYVLWTEYLVSEQNQLWAEATGRNSILNRPLLNWFWRSSIKIWQRAVEQIFRKHLTNSTAEN